MATTCEVCVVGLGVTGSATTWHLARRGVDVVGLDRGDPPHTQGSSHGETRITRLAVGEGDAYVPLVRRSHELWRELESASGTSLLVSCGGLILGGEAATGQHGVSGFVEATIDVARRHGIDHEVLAPDELRSRWGVLGVTDEVGYYEPSAGHLRPEACVRALLGDAERHGASIRRGERVFEVRPRGDAVEVRTDTDVVHARRVVVAAGPWLPALAPSLEPALSVERQVLCWFDVEDHHEAYAALPIFIWFHGADEGDLFYGFPAVAGPHGGVKVATEVYGAPTTPETVDRTTSPAELADLHARHVAGRLLGVSPRVVRAEVCLYTVTPDFGFVLGPHPEHPSIIVASPCSGHGFKHAPAVGECAAALALGEPAPFDVRAFSPERFSGD